MSRSRTKKLAATSSPAVQQFEAQQNEFAKQWPDLALWLKAQGVTELVACYSGSGDSGQFDEWQNQHGDTLQLPMPWADILETKVWDAVDVYHGGFYNNEGGDGRFTFDLGTGEVSWVHNDNVISQDTSTHEGWQVFSE